MGTKTESFNVALGYAKQEVTVVNSEEDTTAARRCRRFYETERKAHLQMYPWSFCRKVQYLSIKTGVTSAAGYNFVYQYPAQVLNLHAVGVLLNQGSVIDEEDNYQTFLGDDHNSKEIHTNFDQARAEVTINITNENLQSALFDKLLGYAMALSLGPLYGLKQSEMEDIKQRYVLAKKEAETASAKEEKIAFDSENEYVEVRGS